MTDTIHTYEITYWNGEEWDEIELYCSYRDDRKIRREFIDQQLEMGEHFSNVHIEYIGEGESNCDIDIENGLLLRVF